jgi:hypothetical protein
MTFTSALLRQRRRLIQTRIEREQYLDPTRQSEGTLEASEAPKLRAARRDLSRARVDLRWQAQRFGGRL